MATTARTRKTIPPIENVGPSPPTISLKQTRPSEKRLAKSPETPLEALDSIDKVNLIVETEMEIEKEFDQPIRLADDAKAEVPEEERNNPFATVASFTEYVESQISLRSS